MVITKRSPDPAHDVKPKAAPAPMFVTPGLMSPLGWHWTGYVNADGQHLYVSGNTPGRAWTAEQIARDFGQIKPVEARDDC